ncbi:MAG: DUF5518 domain-containing protein [Haloarculaceae archaeon]
MGKGDTGLNALVGAVVTIVLAGAVPFAPILGGGIAGYLQGGDRSDGLRVGTISGVIALVPGLLVVAFVVSVLGAIFLGGGMQGMPLAFPALGSVVFFFVFLFAVVYIVGLSAVGGWLGNYVRHDTDVDI